MKTNTNIKKIISLALSSIYSITTLLPVSALASNDELIYPLKEVSKLECRFTDFEDLNSNCKQNLPVLKTKDYNKYANQNNWYNDFTRLYTILWWSSYTYGWDVGNWGHMWVDIATAKWTPVYAMAKWKVINAWWKTAFWNVVSIEHTINGKKVVSNYAHLDKVNVSVWTTVSAWKKIWEVWSTWNSTWNHLHFQIDIDTTYSPIYYDYNSCPYSYYNISEEGVCFDELNNITVDPLLFLETNWAILSKVTTVSNNTSKTYTTTTSNNTTKSDYNLSIFDKTVYVDYAASDIREVQQIYKALGYYNWNITSDYNDVLESVIDYQVDKWVIENRNSTWAGRFWPKTRAQTKVDYEKYLAEGWKETKVYITTNSTTKSNIVTTKIDKKSLMTREEIEEKEVNDFIKNYNIDLKFSSTWDNIKQWKTETLKLEITDKKGKYFKWNMPWDMTFVFNSEKLNVFPTRLYYFTDGKRDIQVKWLEEWNTKLYVKIWNVTVKTFDIKVYNGTKTIYPEDAKIIWVTTSNLGSIKTAIWVFRDSNNKNLINLEFGSTYTLKATEGNWVCIKEWELNNLKKIYNTNCDENDFKQEITFDYSDTVWWLLIFDYKTANKNASFEIINNYNNTVLDTKTSKVSNPKWLTTNYEYKNEVIEMIEDWVTTWVNKWYFLQDRNLTEKDAYTWIKNSLVNLENQTVDNNTKNKINNNIKEVENKIEKASKYNSITRMQFLALNYKYLVFNTNNTNTISYKDLTEEENKIANTVFSTNNTWKDQFWSSYFQPDNTITRWEWAYLISTIFKNYDNNYLTLK